ncbi:MAG: DUF2586 family protein [Deltaproteobacteria bacterium]|nr:DUF2586 family protein [Deltaproteobacteria bacterium]
MLPELRITVQDGQLGLGADVPSGLFAQVGQSSLGTVNSPVAVVDADAVATGFGTGALPTALRDALSAGARRIIAARVAADLAGAISAVAKTTTGRLGAVTKDGTGTGTMTASGTPIVTGAIEVECTTEGQVGAALFRWRRDAGAWSDPFVALASVALAATGLAVQFANGEAGVSFEVGDSFTFDAKAGGTGSVTASGTPTGAHEVEIAILEEGAVGDATFTYRVDGGAWVEPQATSAAFAVPGTGVTVAFVAGVSHPEWSFLPGDGFVLTTTAPQSTVEALTAAIASLAPYAGLLEWIHVVGASAGSVWTAMEALAQTEYAAKFKYLHILCEFRDPLEGETVDQYVAAVLAAGAAVAGTRIAVCAGRLAIGDDERNGAARYCGHLSKLALVSHSPGRVVDGPMLGVDDLAPLDDNGNALVNDAHVEAMDAAGFVTFRKFEGLAGVYVTNGRMKANATSDFRYVEWRRVMDKACREVRVAGLKSMHREATDTGVEALRSDLQQVLDVMRGNAEIVSGRIVIPEGQDFIGTSTIRVKVAIVPVGTFRQIEVTIGLENPFRAAA